MANPSIVDCIDQGTPAPTAQPSPITALLARVIDTLETIECRVLSANADGSALSHLARRAKYDLAAIAHELAGGAA